MAIDFVTEDGTGKEDATSYISLIDFEQYWENRGKTFSDSDNAIKAKLNIATQYVDYLHIYKGSKSTAEQALQFPRTIEPGTIPAVVKNAVCEAAAYELNGNSLETATQPIQSKRMGPVSVTYGSRGQQPPKLTIVEKFLGGLVEQMGVSR